MIVVHFHRYYLFRLNSDKLRGTLGIPEHSGHSSQPFELAVAPKKKASKKKVNEVIVHEDRTARGTKKSVREASPSHERSQVKRTAKAS